MKHMLNRGFVFISGLFIRQPFRVVVRAGTAIVLLSVFWIAMIALMGGLSHLNPGLLLVPIVIAAFYLGPVFGITIAVIIGIAIGPWMDASPGIPQPAADWMIRILSYATVGAMVGIMSLLHHQGTRKTIRTQQSLLNTTPDIIERERLKALREMASGIVHDINNALAPILGFSEMLDKPEVARDPRKVQRYGQAINTSAANASAVVNRLRSFYQQNSGIGPVFPVKLAEIVEQSLAMTEARWKSQARVRDAEIKCYIDCPSDLTVLGNDAELRGVLTNLIFNAVDAMPQGGKLSFRGEQTDNRIALHITDTGYGMDPETLQRCMAPFFTTKKNGTGLGTSLVASIMQYHGGKMEIFSTLGKGTRVDLLFPVPEKEKLKTEPFSETLLQTDPLRVLIVDDDRLVRQMLSEALISNNHHVTEVEDSHQALRIFNQTPERFDVVITDTSMPNMSGHRIASRIREIRPGIPLIMLSGFDSDDRPSLRESGAPTIVIAKPITLNQLHHALQCAAREK